MLFHSERVHFSDRMLITNTIAQLALLTTVLYIGRIRGWSLATFGAKISWKGTGGGILLFAVAFIADFFIMTPVGMLHPEQPELSHSALAMPVILLASIVNPIWEELVTTGYIVNSLQKLGVWRTVLASAFLRALGHMYQGLNGVLSAYVCGIVLGLAYWRWRRLWPIILAHSLNNFFGFTVFA